MASPSLRNAPDFNNQGGCCCCCGPCPCGRQRRLPLLLHSVHRNLFCVGTFVGHGYSPHQDHRTEYSEMTTNVLVTFYSTYGHVHRMALAVAEGAQNVPDTTVPLRRIAETIHLTLEPLTPGRK